jgi:phenylacetate-CoA ligase
MGYACEHCEGGMHHVVATKHLEILKLDKDEPAEKGEIGRLVWTPVDQENTTIQRYEIGDLGRFVDEPCACGRTHVRMGRIMGRTDDMLIIRGVNVFPSQVEAAITGIPGIAPRYMLIVDRVNNLDTLEIQVEMLPDLISDSVREIENLRKTVKNAIEQILGLGVTVTLMNPNTIERSEGKSKHTIDKRKLL